MKTISIGKFIIGLNEPCLILAELGAMQEDLNGMKKLIKVSKEAGRCCKDSNLQGRNYCPSIGRIRI